MKIPLLTLGLILFSAALLPAEVVDSSANGLTVKLTFQVQAPPADVYRKLVQNVGDWWGANHTFSRSPHNLSIEERAGGCFCEKLPDGGGVRHLEVVNFSPGRRLVMTGALGPLQSLAATGTMSIDFASANGGTKMDVVYTVAGYLPKGMDTWAGPVNAMLTETFGRLKNYVEHGDPAGQK